MFLGLLLFWIVGHGQLFQKRCACCEIFTLKDGFKSADNAACLKYSNPGTTHTVAGSFHEVKDLALQSEAEAFNAQFLDVGFHASKFFGFLTMLLRQCKDFARPDEQGGKVEAERPDDFTIAHNGESFAVSAVTPLDQIGCFKFLKVPPELPVRYAFRAEAQSVVASEHGQQGQWRDWAVIPGFRVVAGQATQECVKHND